MLKYLVYHINTAMNDENIAESMNKNKVKSHLNHAFTNDSYYSLH